MILAQNATQALFLMIFGMLCWGLWASMYKLTGRWRYELFYFDVAFGLAIAVVLYSPARPGALASTASRLPTT